MHIAGQGGCGSTWLAPRDSVYAGWQATHLARCTASFEGSGRGSPRLERGRRAHPPQRRVPVVFDVVVRASGKTLRDFGPAHTARAHTSGPGAYTVPSQRRRAPHQEFPSRRCASIKISSSSADHSPLRTRGSRWFSHRSRHCLLFRFAISDATTLHTTHSDTRRRSVQPRGGPVHACVCACACACA